jgi:hypothetical protein
MAKPAKWKTLPRHLAKKSKSTKARTPRVERPRQDVDRTIKKAITPVEYDAWQTAFEYLNRALFKGELPDVFITYQRQAHMRVFSRPTAFQFAAPANRASMKSH